MKATGVFLILHLFVSYGYGQNSILFTIDENQVMVDEFAYTFAKNNNGGATRDEIDEYLTLYICRPSRASSMRTQIACSTSAGDAPG